MEWKAGLAEETLKGRLTELSFAATLSELSSEPAVIMFREFVMYLYQGFVLNAGTQSRDQERRAFEVYELWSATRRRLTKQRSSLFFTLPVLLLSLRALVEGLFSSAFPLWTATADGEEALKVGYWTI